MPARHRGLGSPSVAGVGALRYRRGEMSSESGSISRAALREMLVEALLPPAEVDARFARATDRAYWSRLCPMLTLEGAAAPETRGGALAPPDSLARLARDGWLRSEPFFAKSAVGPIVAGIEALARDGWPPVFVFLFDDVWQMMRHPAMVELFAEVLGGDLVQLPFLWCHRVAAQRGASGWRPHADKADKAGGLTVWLPLTDATLENGCMVMLPRGAVAQEVQDRFLAGAQLSHMEVMTLLQGAHAVPASAGAVLAWDAATIHWGGRCVEATTPRISLAFSFASRPVDAVAVPECWGGFTDARGAAPSFEERLRSVGTALRRYWSEEPLIHRWDPLAKRLEKS